jgi:L-lactate dehydrogenase complex protein LldG
VSREEILAAVRRGLPPPCEHPGTAPPRPLPEAARLARLAAALEAAGGTLARLGAEVELPAWLGRAHPRALHVLSGLPELPGSGLGASPPSDPRAFSALDLAVCRGEFAVAENGAVWVPAGSLPHPAALFLAEHLALVVRAADLVSDMHEAYARLARAPLPPYGVFVAGPSKTADIEQALVVGAQGPRSLALLLIG